MERRSFIIKSIIGGIGLSLIPSIAFSNHNFEVIDIGNVNIHHRHGNLYSSSQYKIKHPFFRFIQRDVFLKNGISESKEDAFQIKLITKDDVMHTFFISPNSKNKVHFFEGYKLTFVDSSNINLLKNDFILPISSKTKGYIASEKQLININEPHVIISKS